VLELYSLEAGIKSLAFLNSLRHGQGLK
jgi:hypothetical protein